MSHTTKKDRIKRIQDNIDRSHAEMLSGKIDVYLYETLKADAKKRISQIRNEPTLRGGAREGSGRPRRSEPTVGVTVKLDREDADRLKRLCRERGVTQVQVMNRGVWSYHRSPKRR